MSKFPTGVYVDARGVLKPLVKEESAGKLAALREASGPRRGGDDARRNSTLRMVSLTRLEKQVQLLLAAGRQPSEDMQVLAGLQRIQYVFVYPESGDLVLAGPAGDWKPGPENILVSADTGGPVVRLDDLVVVLRHDDERPAGRVRLPDQSSAGGAGPSQGVREQVEQARHPARAAEALAGATPRPGGQARHRGLWLGSRGRGRRG